MVLGSHPLDGFHPSSLCELGLLPCSYARSLLVAAAGVGAATLLLLWQLGSIASMDLMVLGPDLGAMDLKVLGAEPHGSTILGA